MLWQEGHRISGEGLESSRGQPSALCGISREVMWSLLGSVPSKVTHSLKPEAKRGPTPLPLPQNPLGHGRPSEVPSFTHSCWRGCLEQTRAS